jgi:hypothetical protein
MRTLILVAGIALAVSACGKNQATDNAVVIDANADAQNVASNDTTAIDAATGEDANMAADVNFSVNEFDNLPSSDNSTDNASADNAT